MRSTHSTWGSSAEPCTLAMRGPPGTPAKVPLSLSESPTTFTALMPSGLSSSSSPPPQADRATATARAVSFQFSRGLKRTGVSSWS